MMTLRSMAVASLLALPAVLFPAPENNGINLTMAPQENGSPIFIHKAKSTLEYVFQEVTVRNTGNRPITAIKFGVAWRTRPSDGFMEPVHFWPGRSVPVNLEPGQEQTIHAFVMSHDQMRETVESVPAKSRAAQLGVLEVTYADGQKWTFDTTSVSGFDASGI